MAAVGVEFRPGGLLSSPPKHAQARAGGEGSDADPKPWRRAIGRGRAAARYAGPVVSGLLVGFTYRAEIVPSYTLLVALLPVLLFLRGAAGDRRRVLVGFALFVLIEHVLLGYWVYALADYSPLAIPLFAGMIAWLGLFPMLFAIAARSTLARTGWPLALVAPPLWVTFDLLRSTVPFGMRGADLGYAAWKNPILIQTADVAGAFGVTFLIVLVNALSADLVASLAEARHGGSRRVPAAWIAGLALVLVVPAAYGGWRMARLDTRPGPLVSVVQPNPLPAQRLDPDRAAEIWDMLGRLTRSIPRSDLVVWPEGAVPGAWVEDPRGPGEGAEVRRRLEETAREGGAALLAGVVSVAREPDGRLRFHNAVVALDSAGAERGIYRKIVLVPFAEGDPLPGWNPLAGPHGRGGGLRLGGLTPGSETPALDLGPVRVGAMICYEQMFPAIARRETLAGADVLVGLTNDSWFDRSYLTWWFSGSIALRAVENRRPVVRAALTGISLFVDPLGRVEARTPVRQQAVLTRRVILGPAETTVYTRHGEVAAGLAVVAAAVLFLAGLRRTPGRWQQPRKNPPRARASR